VLHPGKLCLSRDDAKRSNRAKFANMRESRPLRCEKISPGGHRPP
jgi:hypothetical protein